MRVVVVTTSFPRAPGDPSGHFVASEAEALRQRGHEVVVLAPGPAAPGGGSPPGSSGGPGHLRVEPLGGGEAFGWPGVGPRLREAPWRGVAAGAFLARARSALLRHERDHGVDAIVAHWALPCGWPVALPSAAPLTLVSHGADVRLLLALPAPVRAAVVKRLAARAARWRFVAVRLRDRLLAALPGPLAGVVEAMARVEPSPLAWPELAPPPRGEASRTYVVAGRLVASKRIDEALHHVARKYAGRAPPRVLVLGDGPERRRLEAVAQQTRLDVRFLGLVPRAEALGWIATADALLFAARRDEEGEPTVLREAAHLGTPVEWVA